MPRDEPVASFGLFLQSGFGGNKYLSAVVPNIFLPVSLTTIYRHFRWHEACFDYELSQSTGGKKMFTKVLCLVVVGILLSVAGVRPAYARSREEKETRLAEQVKEG